MARNNDVFRVLVTREDHPVLPVGEQVTDLLPGQIGVFNASTNVSIDGSVPTKNFYLAVGVDKDGDGVTDDIIKSTGSSIQTKNIKFYSYRPHTASRPMKVVLKDYVADCETEYGIKIEMRNQQIYRSQGYNQFTKTYSLKTSCCTGCTPTCPSGDANEITRLLYINMMNDTTGLIKPHILPRGDVAAAGVTPDPVTGYLTLADIDTIMAYNATQTDVEDYVFTDLEIETVTQAINNFCNVNTNYFYPRETVIIPTLVGNFRCNGTLEITQEAAFEEGNGYDIKQLEYEANGWTQGHYRVSSLLGLAQDRTFNADVREKYDQFALTHDQYSQGAWLEYFANQATLLAIPAEDTTTRDEIVAILDALTSPLGFDALADDVALADTDPEVVEPTTDIDNPDEDGIG